MNMRICIDSNQFIFGISGTDPASEALLLHLPYLEVVIPRLVIKEVTRNLREAQVKSLYALLSKAPRVTIIDAPVPVDLVNKYSKLNLPEKANAIIGAFVEWQGAQYLISDNRHFLEQSENAAFEVLTPDKFLQIYAQASRDK
jgi:predicted nucleic acid-binding protein